MVKRKAKEGVKIVPSGVFPEKHEHETADYFLKLGRDVKFIKPSRTKGTKNADVEIDGIRWEMKNLSGKSKRSVGDHLSKASRQSVNIILDTRRFQLDENYVVTETVKQFGIRRKIKRIWLITRSQKLIDFHR
jgi:hypothetical protein